MSLHAEVLRFKAWAESQDRSDGWEQYYSNDLDLLNAAEETLKLPKLDDESIECLLYALARTHEGEMILDLLERYPGNALSVAQRAVNEPDMQARWQIACLLGRFASDEARDLLRRFLSDDEEYVRRRALLAMIELDPEVAEMEALHFVASPFEYSRLAGLNVLHDLKSEYLKEVLDLLQYDSSTLVRKRANEITNSL